ncbi:MAG: cytochrome c3 family protein [Bdellovibrionales bacterium]|nr:cytochrome c3 family protein [Bdellovibrionales bacterium]
MNKKVIGAAVVVGLLGGLSGLIYLLTSNSVTIGYNQGYQPDQPIAFSHELHAGQQKIDCKYCHVAPEVSRHSSVPSLNICMNCHLTVGLDKPGGQKLMEMNSNGEPIAWQKVHLLPDHVKFNHSAHILKGKVCQECHGPVETMPVVYQYSSLSMGWCVNCHRKPENNAATECSTCHY